MNRNQKGAHRAGFTLVELMMVVLIIVILMSILVPLVSKVRIKAYGANTAAQIGQLRSACEAYKQTFGRYPGPLNDEDIFYKAPGAIARNIGGTRVTEAENLVLGLLGGLTLNGAGTSTPPYTYDATKVGSGISNLNANDPKVFPPLMEGWQDQLSSAVSGTGRFKDTRSTTTGDSDVPEFVDRYPLEPMPILYLRARPGATGVMSNANSAAGPFNQYDFHMISPYVNTAVNGLTQGLTAAGNINTALAKDVDPKHPTKQNYLPYFLDTSANTPGGLNANTAVPRQKDAFILISAGPDRVYGTSDDITNFGSVFP